YARLGFSVAISVDPGILIVDEVLSVGDEAFQRKCFDRINEFKRRAKTIIFVSHTLPVVENLCNRVLWLHKGRIAAEGSAVQSIQAYTRELQRREELSRAAEERNHPAGGSGTNSARSTGSDIRRVEVLGEDGRERRSFRSGETVRLRVHYRVADSQSQYGLVLELRRSDGLLLQRTFSPRTAPLPLSSDGLGTAEVVLYGLPLLAGTYEFALAVKELDDTTGPIHLADHGRCSLTIWSDEGEAGLVSLHYGWLWGHKSEYLR